MADLTELQAAGATKVVGSNSSGVETNPLDVESDGSAKVVSKTRDGSGNAITSDSNGNAGKQRLHTSVPDTTTASTSLGALNATVQIAMAGLSSVGFQLNAGTLVGTIIPECSIDGGTTWTACTFFDPANSSVITSIVFSSNNALKIFSVLPIGGSSHVRIRVSVYTSGTANSLLRASQVTGAAGAITAAAFGTVSNAFTALTPNTATLILVSNPNRKYAYIANSTGTAMTIQMGTGTGLSNTTGIEIPARTYFEFTGGNLYTGNIYGFASSGITVSVTEGTP